MLKKVTISIFFEILEQEWRHFIHTLLMHYNPIVKILKLFIIIILFICHHINLILGEFLFKFMFFSYFCVLHLALKFQMEFFSLFLFLILFRESCLLLIILDLTCFLANFMKHSFCEVFFSLMRFLSTTNNRLRHQIQGFFVISHS